MAIHEIAFGFIGMPSHKRFFTVDQANALLPEIRAIVEEIRALNAEIASQAPDMEPVTSRAKVNGGHKNGTNYASRLTQFYDRLNSITQIGCVLKDIDLGLIDFPSIRDGREAYLCWRLGEDKIGFWHELDTGFSSRKPL